MSKDQRNGQRNKRSIGKRSGGPDLGYYYIVTDTKETEQNYMNGLKASIPEAFRRRMRIYIINFVNMAMKIRQLLLRREN